MANPDTIELKQNGGDMRLLLDVDHEVQSILKIKGKKQKRKKLEVLLDEVMNANNILEGENRDDEAIVHDLE